MNARKLGKKDVGKFLEGARAKGYEVWAPVRDKGAVEMRPLANGASPALDFGNTRSSLKGWIFPQSERMFTFHQDRSREDAFVLKEVAVEKSERLAFGVRPCDARSLVLLDKVFLVQGTKEDPFYGQKRGSGLLVGLGCSAPCATCFCHWTGGGPFSTEGLDLLLTDLGEHYLVESASEKGESLLDAAALPAATAEDQAKAAQIAAGALAGMGEAVDPRPARKRPLLELFADPLWDRAHESCIKCGTCTYLCPTCSCFDIQDEAHGTCGARGRNWDSCMFSLTTLHASGHNPRPTGKERFRQRFMHKLRYFQDDFDTIMCVGCGRCVQQCPVNIDIREIIQALGA